MIVEVVLSLAKIAVMLGVFVTMMAVATWADRRQSAMVQDRVGPNRAVVRLPSDLGRLLVLLPPTILAGFAFAPAVPWFAAYDNLRLPQAFEVLTLTTQLAVLVGWLGLLVLSGVVQKSGARNGLEAALGRNDPRNVFYVGVGVHAVGFLATSMVGAENVVTAARVTGAALGAVLSISGIYAAARVPEGGVELRLAGLLHSVADGVKLVLKEDFVPKNADRLLHALAPMISFFPALVTMAVIPFGQTLWLQVDPQKALDFADLARIAPGVPRDLGMHAHAVRLQIADLNVGILYMFALGSTGVIGAALAGWASDNKFSLLGGLRAASQMVSYEVAMGLSLVGLFLVYGTVRLGPMVEWQSENAWGIFVQPFAFLLFLAALSAETKRIPFDQPEGESEIVAGYFVEYSGMKFGMFYMGEYIDLIVSSALLVTLFFGGYSLPFLHADGITVSLGDAIFFQYRMNHLAVVVITMLAFFGKTMLMTWVQIFFRWTLPRFRYDQVMKLGWTKLLPLSLANMMVTGLLVLAAKEGGPGVQSALRLGSDLSQALVALGALLAFVAIVVGLLEPVERKKFLQSTAARFAAAAGGTKATAQQA